MTIWQSNSSRSSPRAYDLSSLEFLTLIMVSGMDCGLGFKSRFKVVGSSHVCITVAPVVMSCQATGYCSLQCLQLGILIHIAPSNTMKANQQDQSYQVRTSLIFPHLKTQVCGVFCSRLHIVSKLKFGNKPISYHKTTEHMGFPV